MNAREIQRLLMFDRYRRSLVCPNYTPANWWECDIFELTEAGFFREYEIKLSTADFRADKEKRRNDYNVRRGVLPQENKHDLLAARDVRGPTQFWFVTTPDVIPAGELPEWAGHILCIPNPQAVRNIQIELVKDAPRLHREKANPKIKEHLESIFYYRFHTLFLRLKDSATLDPERAMA